mmetsp:Transcript_16121/g.30449  ORF Transcript_16121/g.30449 Transcript_16121/m.30449 type:complete len:465 (-) Transcript_16121:3122-4516(-)
MKFLDKANILLVSSGTISFSASTLTAVMINRSIGGLLTPYRRIIFGLCISDMIQSFAVVIGPFFVPKECIYSSSWAIGNIRTCELQGFLITFGAATTCMYTLFLCVYYFCKIKKNMSDNNVRNKFEGRMHPVIFLLNFTVCIAALVTKTYNPLAGGGTCHFVRNPIGCDPSIPGDCLRGKYAPIFTMSYYPIAMPCLCIFFALTFLITIVWHVVTKDRIFRTIERVPAVAGSASIREIQVDRVARLLRRETILQVVLYLSAFLLTYGLPFAIAIFNLMNSAVPDPIKCTTSALFPLSGLFNILIYTRPQVVAFRRLHEGEYSWPRALWRVIKAGGENPDAVESSAAPLFCCCLCGGPRWIRKEGAKYDIESLPSQMRYPALRSLLRFHQCSKDEQDGFEGENKLSSVDSSPIHGCQESQPLSSLPLSRDDIPFGSTSAITSERDRESLSDLQNDVDNSPDNGPR